MNNNRRKFLRRLTIGSGVLATGIPSFANTFGVSDEQMERSSQFESKGQHFNMCGYAAPKVETVRIGVIG
jgi:hypothetical protein